LFQVLIALFISFRATWIAIMLAKQISVPISGYWRRPARFVRATWRIA